VAGSKVMEWRKALLSASASIEQAIESLNTTGLQIVLIVGGRGELIGTITDGDIRRGLLRGRTLRDSIDDVILRTPLVVPPDMKGDTVIQLMRANRIHQLPVVDDKGVVVGLHLWDAVGEPTARPNSMIIMAGGMGKRLQPHTENCPKPLLPVAGKPMLEHILERAKAEGFYNFVISIRYLGNMIEDYFGAGEKWGVGIRYLREDQPLGTAGGLSLLAPLPSDPFIITNGDVLTDIRYGELLDFHVLNKAAATMAVRQYEWQHPFGVVETKGIDITGFEEKPIYRSHVNAGIYALSPSALRPLKHDEHCDMPTLFRNLQLSGERTVVYPMHEPWLDVGQPSDYAKASQAISPRS
jgi:dTDP-glucose pyrophosphorylase